MQFWWDNKPEIAWKTESWSASRQTPVQFILWIRAERTTARYAGRFLASIQIQLQTMNWPGSDLRIFANDLVTWYEKKFKYNLIKKSHFVIPSFYLVFYLTLLVLLSPLLPRLVCRGERCWFVTAVSASTFMSDLRSQSVLVLWGCCYNRGFLPSTSLTVNKLWHLWVCASKLEHSIQEHLQ